MTEEEPIAHFDQDAFLEAMRMAAIALDQAVDMVDQNTCEECINERHYLLARLHIAQEIIELELPEFQHGVDATIAGEFDGMKES